MLNLILKSLQTFKYEFVQFIKIKMVKEKEARIKAIIFDVGGVLAIPTYPVKLLEDHNYGVHHYVADKLQIVLDQWFDAIDTAYVKSMEGKISEKETIRIISKNLGISGWKLKRLIVKAYKKNFYQNKELYKIAFGLRKKGYKIAVLSDQWHLSKRALIKKRYMKKFNAVVISCDIGVRKPNAKIYKIVLKKLKLSAKNCLFIDNQMWNIKSAQKLGVNCILFKNNKQLFKEFDKFGVYVDG